jgi:hypothetical protein
VSKYDLAVVGSGLAGLTAAAAAARMQKRVIVLEREKVAGGALAGFERDGYRFYPGPSLSYGFERGGVFQTLEENFGLSQSALLRSPCYQVTLPDRRITVYAEHSETLAELRREFPSEIDRIIRFFQDLRSRAANNGRSRVAAFLSRRRSAASIIRGYRFSPEFILFLDVQSRYFFGRPVEILPLTSLITLIDAAPLTVTGGFKRLVDHLVATIVKNQGEIRYNVPFSDLVIRRHGVDMPSEAVDANVVLLNERERQGTRVCMGVQSELVPVSMLPDVLCAPSYAVPGCFFTLALSARDDEKTAPRGKRAVMASFSSSCPDQGQDDRIRAIAAIMPFLEDFTIFSGECSLPVSPLKLPGDLSLRPVRISGTGQLLSRSSRYGVSSIPDGSGAPADEVMAAQRFLEFIK